MGGTVDVHAHVKIHAWCPEKINSLSGRLTVLLHVIGVLRRRLQIRSETEHA